LATSDHLHFIGNGSLEAFRVSPLSRLARRKRVTADPRLAFLFRVAANHGSL